jgi:hypothetical protein
LTPCRSEETVLETARQAVDVENAIRNIVDALNWQIDAALRVEPFEDFLFYNGICVDVSLAKTSSNCSKDLW